MLERQSIIADYHTDAAPRRCPLAVAANQVGDRWTIQILWALMNGYSRFDQMQSRLGIARNILSERLLRLAEIGLVDRVPITEGKRRMQYVLNPRTEGLRSTFLSLREWGRERMEEDEDAVV